MTKKQKLELTWIGKENRPKLEPRILLEDPEKSYHAKQRVTDHDIFDNRLIFGDNLLALKALEQEFAGKVKCVYIDPPFNTGEMFAHYDDGLEHSLWLTQMRDRLVILHRLLTDDGTLFVHIDDNELAYLTVLLDEVFARKNRLYTVTFKQGSGTTAAVAHKMKRRWITVELGDHAHTHIIPRMKKVIDGEDPGGITKAVGWKGGGGFRYYRLAPSLLERDRFGNLIISKQYNAAMLAEAMCKLMGFTYAPSEEVYWQHGYSTESDFIYVTTQTLTRDHLTALSEEVGKKRSLLICCSAFRGKADAFRNLTLKKIPLAVLHKCEWGHDDYSLNVANLPKAPEPASEPAPDGLRLPPKQARRRRARSEAMPSLFGNGDNGGAE